MIPFFRTYKDSSSYQFGRVGQVPRLRISGKLEHLGATTHVRKKPIEPAVMHVFECTMQLLKNALRRRRPSKSAKRIAKQKLV